MSSLRNLLNLGLSQPQADIYLFLVENNEARVGDISRGTGIPRSSVYQNLKGLTDYGLVEEIVDGGLTRIKASPISMFKHTLIEQHAKIEDKLAMLKRLEQEPDFKVSGKSQDGVVRYFKGVSGARQLFWNTLKSRDTVLVYSAFGRSKFVGKRFYIDFVKESGERQIREKVIINPTSHALGLIKRDTGTSIARTEIKNIRYLTKKIMLIEGETFIYDSIYAVLYLRDRRIVGFEVESIDFVKTQRSVFKTLWELAKPLKGFLK